MKTLVLLSKMYPETLETLSGRNMETSVSSQRTVSICWI